MDETMDEERVSVSDVYGQLKEIADENPDYIYPDEAKVSGKCVYTTYSTVTGTRVRCVIGELLVRYHGIKDYEFDYYDCNVAVSVEDLAVHMPGRFAPFGSLAMDLMTEVQSKQDLGFTWSEAVRLGAGNFNTLHDINL